MNAWVSVNICWCQIEAGEGGEVGQVMAGVRTVGPGKP